MKLTKLSTKSHLHYVKPSISKLVLQYICSYAYSHLEYSIIILFLMEGYFMANNENKVSVSKLSTQSQQKLEEIRQQHHLKTLDEAMKYMLDFTKKSRP